MKEIEILVRVLEPKASALKKLSKYKKYGTVQIIDKYFYNPRDKDMVPTKNGFTKNFRMRRKGNKSYITFKTDRFDGKGGWLYSDELETEVGDAKEAENIIRLLGLKPLVVVNNKRTIYNHKNYEIALEEVRNLGLFLEVEAKHPKGTPQNVRKGIFEFMKEIGIKTSKEVTQAKPELLLKKSRFKN